MDDDDRLGEDCIKLLTAEEAEAPYQNYMKNGKGEETTMGALGVLGSMDVVAWFDVTMVETLVFSIKCRGFQQIFPWTNSAIGTWQVTMATCDLPVPKGRAKFMELWWFFENR